MGDFLRLSPWSGGPRENFFARFVAHCESCAQDVENAILRLGLAVVVFLERERKTL